MTLDDLALLMARPRPAPLVLRITTATQVVYVGPFRTRVEAMVAKVDLEYRSAKRMTIRVMHLPFYAKLTTVAGRG